MRETFICKLTKHNVYYINNPYLGYYILVPFTDYNDTNISIRLKGNYQSYDLSKNSLESVTSEIREYYKNIDNYNITLILPVFNDDILDRIRMANDLTLYQKLDNYLATIFNSAYAILTKNNIKVNNNIYIINNDTFNNFTNWYVTKYNNRIEYKTVLELIKENDNFSNYNVVETPNINFVVGKNDVPKLEKTVEMEVQTFDNISREVIKESTKKEVSNTNSGFVSYILLGTITFGISLLLLYLFIK